MAPEWESMAMGIDFGMGMEASQYYSNGSAAAAAPFSSVAQCFDYPYGVQSNEHTLHIDELLDFSNQELVPAATTTDAQLFAPPLTDHQQPSAAGSGFFSADQYSAQSSSFDLYFPQEEAAELEWLSKFVDDSFSDVPYQSMTMIAPPTSAQPGQLRIEQSSVTAGRGARSKRSRTGAGNTQAAAWSSLVHHPQLTAAQSSPSSSSSSSSDITSLKPNPHSYNPHHNSNINTGKKVSSIDAGHEGGVRRCTHCASEKTPQWRTGPLGPKTLCNACGVRYKSGRLVPEYRPAASPTFVLTQHSNSHRKVMELRRQKEIHIINNAASSAAAAAHAARPELMFSDYGVC